MQELQRTGGNGDTILKRRTQTFTCTGSQDKAKSPWESESNLTALLGGHPGKTGVNMACCEGRTLEAKLLGIFSSMPFSGGGHFGKNLVPPVSAEKPQGKQQSRWDHNQQKRLKTTKKDILHSERKEKPQEEGRRGTLAI